MFKILFVAFRSLLEKNTKNFDATSSCGAGGAWTTWTTAMWKEEIGKTTEEPAAAAADYEDVRRE